MSTVNSSLNWSAYQVFISNSTVDEYTDISSAPTEGTLRVTGGIACTGNIKGEKVYNGVWNDIADCIEVPEDTKLIPGFVYCFDGEKYYKSKKYMDDGIIGIHSDTAGFLMGLKDSVKELHTAVSGFALAYVDKEYKPGTPLTCARYGKLTEISKKDKIENPEKIIATFWKPEKEEEWGPEGQKVKVNNRMWVKIKLS